MTQLQTPRKRQWRVYVMLILSVAAAIAIGMYDDKPEIPEPAPPRVPPVPPPAPRYVEPITPIPPMIVPPPPPR